jgi:hypothetical protein
MKKTIILIFLLLLSSYIIFAQRYAVQGGLNTAAVTTNESWKYGTKMGFHLGFYLNIDPASMKNWAINTGISYSLRGFRSNHPNIEYASVFDRKSGLYFTNLHNMLFPLTVSYKINEFKNKFAIVPELGFYGSVIFIGKLLPEEHNKTDIRGDFGLRGGLAFEFFEKFQIGASYDYGFLNLSKQNNIKWTNNVFEYYLRFFF